MSEVWLSRLPQNGELIRKYKIRILDEVSSVSTHGTNWYYVVEMPAMTWRKGVGYWEQYPALSFHVEKQVPGYNRCRWLEEVE